MFVKRKKAISVPLLLETVRAPFLALIRLYQMTLSPDHGLFKKRFPYGYCPFFPSCSEYAFQKIKKNGIFLGGFLAVWRVLRCHPWTKGGVDLP